MIDISGVPAAGLGDVVTIIGEDGGDAISVEDVARHQGAPSAAYWQVALRNVPFVTEVSD